MFRIVYTLHPIDAEGQESKWIMGQRFETVLEAARFLAKMPSRGSMARVINLTIERTEEGK